MAPLVWLIFFNQKKFDQFLDLTRLYRNCTIIVMVLFATNDFVSFICSADEVDVIGYTSNQSDSDDHGSVESMSSDSGVAMSTSRLSLAEVQRSI